MADSRWTVIAATSDKYDMCLMGATGVAEFGPGVIAYIGDGVGVLSTPRGGSMQWQADTTLGFTGGTGLVGDVIADAVAAGLVEQRPLSEWAGTLL